MKTFGNSLILGLGLAAAMTIASPALGSTDYPLALAEEGQLKSFVEYCKDDSADQKLKNTVRALKEAVGEDDCTAADTALKELDELILYGENISMLEPLATFTALKILDLSRNAISNVAPLKALTNLQLVDLSRNPLGDLSPLKEMAGLKALGLSKLKATGSYEGAVNLQQLSGFTGLNELNISGNTITNFAELSSLTGIEYLDVSELKGVDSFAPVGKLTKLIGLVVKNNNLSDTSFLQSLSVLRGLDISGNPKMDTANVAILKTLMALTISRSELKSLDMVKDMADLEQLSASRNAISDLSPLADKQYLTHLNVAHNSIESLAPIKSLPSLLKLGMRNNPLGSTVEKTADNCPTSGEGINEAVASFCEGGAL